MEIYMIVDTAELIIYCRLNNTIDRGLFGPHPADPVDINTLLRHKIIDFIGIL